MNIVVCVKQVPDTNEVKFDRETGTLIRTGIPTIINPDDKAAIELALQLKDNYEAHVTILSMGPPQAQESLKEAIAMGADEGVLLTDRRFAGSDTWATSISLASAIKKLPYDLVICGRQAIDGDTAQVGPQVAEHLGIPQVTYCEQMSYEDGKFKVKRQFEQGYFMMELPSPCLITALAETTEPRYMTVEGILKATETDCVKVWTCDDTGVDLAEIGLKGSPTRVKKSMNKVAKAKGEVFSLPTRESAELIVNQLKEKRFIV